MRFVFVAAGEHGAGIRKESLRNGKCLVLLRHPAGIFIPILVTEAVAASVVGRVDADARNVFAIPKLHKAERLKILTMKQNAVGLLIYVAYRFEQTRREFGGEIPRVHHQRWVRLQELRLELLAIARGSQIALDLVNRKELYPLRALILVGGDLRVERVGDTADCDAIASLDHKLFLQPQLLLEVLKLGKKVDDLARNHADDLDLGEVLLDARRGFVLHVVQVHDFVLDVEVQLPAEEGPEVLVDEIVEGVARGVALKVRLQPRIVELLAARCDVRLGQLSVPLRQCGGGHV